MTDFIKFINTYTKRLNQPIKDFDDVREAMASLKELRNAEIKMDMEVTPIEVIKIM